MPARGNESGSRLTSVSINQAAVDLFFKHGYEATTLRQIAAKVGLQVGSLYNYITGKQELLFRIMSGIMEELIAEEHRQLEGVAGPVERLRLFIETDVVFHANRSKEVFIGNSEIRSLSRPDRKKIVALRDQFEEILAAILREGEARGDLHVADVKMVSYAILAACSGVSSWFNPRGRFSAQDIARVYADYIVRGLIARSVENDRPVAISAGR
ncbi:MAG: TetR/AcrR family transcriptional regulator [Chloroflexota bacterium]